MVITVFCVGSATLKCLSLRGVRSKTYHLGDLTVKLPDALKSVMIQHPDGQWQVLPCEFERKYNGSSSYNSQVFIYTCICDDPREYLSLRATLYIIPPLCMGHRSGVIRCWGRSRDRMFARRKGAPSGLSSNCSVGL